MNPETELVAFELSGGPVCGGLFLSPLRAPGATYLVQTPRAAEPGVRDVWAYRFANRSVTAGENAGAWVLEFERYVGFRGISGGVASDQGPVAREEEEQKGGQA